MSQKAVDKFMEFLEQKKLTKLTPAAFTQSEIITYATLNDFHFTRDALTRKIHDIKESNENELKSDIEKAWKKVL